MKHALPILILGGLTGMCWWLSRQPEPTAPSRATAATSVPPGESISRDVSNANSDQRPVTFSASTRRSLSDQLIHALRSGSATERDHGLTRLLPLLVEQDPAAAGHLALAWEAGAQRDELLAQVVRLWSAQDVGGALTWLTCLLDGPDRQLAALSMVSAVAQNDLAGALDLARSLQVGLNDGSAERMAQLWAEENPQAAVDWATQQPSGPLRDRLLARIVHVRAQQDPAAAAQLVAREFAPGTIRDEAALSVVRQWARRDTSAASAWVGAFPAGPLRESAFAELVTVGRSHQL